MSELRGQCLCGDVKVIGKGELDYADACHCTMCRQQNGGGAYYAAHFNEGMEIKGDALKWYGASDYAERGFCSNCGSTISWRMNDYPDMQSLSLGLFQKTGAKIDVRIFVDEAGDYAPVPTDVKHQTAEECIAAFQAKFAEQDND